MQEDLWLSNFSSACWWLLPTVGTKSQGVKNVLAVILASSVRIRIFLVGSGS
jgi:hypothetical protein